MPRTTTSRPRTSSSPFGSRAASSRRCPADRNVVADFSSRGPSLSDANFVKPDVTAPGVDILAGQTPDVANGLRGETYQYMSGTSQVGARGHGRRRAAQGSASDVVAERAQVGADDDDLRRGGPHRRRARRRVRHGRRATSTRTAPSIPASSTTARSPTTPRICAACPSRRSPPADCAAHAAAGRTSSAVDLNLPSIGVAELISGDVVRRRVTNVGPPASFTAEVIAPPGPRRRRRARDARARHGPDGASSACGSSTSGAERDLWSFGELAWAQRDASRREPDRREARHRARAARNVLDGPARERDRAGRASATAAPTARRCTGSGCRRSTRTAKCRAASSTTTRRTPSRSATATA